MANKYRSIQLKKGSWDVYPVTVASEVKYSADNGANVTNVGDTLTNLQLHTQNLEMRLRGVEDNDIPELDANNITYNGGNLDTALDSYNSRIQTLETNGSTTVVSKIDKIEKDITSIKSTNNSQDTKVNTLENKVSTVETEISSIKSINLTQNNRLSSAESDIDSLESNVSSLSTSVNKKFTDLEKEVENSFEVVNSDISSIKLVNTSQSNSINTINSDLVAINSRLSGLDKSLDELEDTVNNRLEEEISNINTEITGLDNRITTNKDDIDSLETFINDIKVPEEYSWLLKGNYINWKKVVSIDVEGSSTKTSYPYLKLDNHSNRIADLENICNGLEQSLEQSVSDLNNRIDENVNNISELDNRLDTAESNISRNADDISELDNRTDVLEEEMTSTKSRVTKNEEDIATNKTDIANLDTRVTKNEEDIATNKTDIANLDTRITKNESDISGLGNRVTTLENTSLRIVSLTQAQYDALPEYDFNVIYCIIDGKSTISDLLERVQNLEQSNP